MTTALTKQSKNELLDMRYQKLLSLKRFGTIEASIYEASKCDRIKNLDISEYSTDMEAVIEQAMKDIGLRLDRLDHYQMARIKEFVKMYYSNLTIPEIKLAFSLLLAGELDNYLPTNQHAEPDRNHYGDFSLNFLTKILNAFKKKRNVAVGNVVKEIHSVQEDIPEEQRKVLDTEFAKRVYLTFSLYRDGESQPDWHFNTWVFEYLKKLHIIPDMEERVFKPEVLRLAKFNVFSRENEYQKQYLTSMEGLVYQHPIIQEEANQIWVRNRVIQAFNEIRKNKDSDYLKKLIEIHEGIKLN